jgi:hypothetical protein
MIMKLCVLAVGLVLVAGSAGAATYIDTFDSGTDGWVNDTWSTRGQTTEGALTSEDVDGAGGHNNALRIAAVAPTAEYTDMVYTEESTVGSILDDANNGNLSSVEFRDGGPNERAMFATFDFWANAGGPLAGDYEPAKLEFFFYDGSTYWMKTLYDAETGSLIEGWNEDLTVSWWGWEGVGWESEGATQTFLNTLDAVTEMGIMVTYQGYAGTEEYGIDNFELHNPEPGTYAVLAFALMSLGVTFRGKLQSGLKGLLRK